MAAAARQLVLSRNTVKMHMRLIDEKLEVHTQRDAISVERLTGLLSVEALHREGG